MKIGILTLPLHSNYGGILQAYALQKVLKAMGHEAIFLDRRRLDEKPTVGVLRCKIKNMLRPLYYTVRSFLEHEVYRDSNYNTYGFIHQFLVPISEPLYTTDELKHEISRLQLDSIVVGSDQVWRPWNKDPKFIRLKDYFLDFIPGTAIHKWTYAVSFGKDSWEVGDADISDYKKMAQSFAAISVREESGIEIVKQHLNRDAIQVLDPTLLLDKESYIALAGENSCTQGAGKLFSYMLDKSTAKRAMVERMSQLIDREVEEITPIGKYKILPSPINWIRAFMNADFVITDSFHGCVFSIIFNKQFIALGNEGRGQARFSSLFRIFGLENRLVEEDVPVNVAKDKLLDEIGWDKVNRIKTDWQQISKSYITESLKRV